MFNMVLPKHSYVFSKDFILCCLAEDKKLFYGEILYGKSSLKNVRNIKIGKDKYYKYWELEKIKKIGSVYVGKKTNYMKYLTSTKRLYPKNYIQHPIMGNLFGVPKKEVIKIMSPKKYNELNKFQKKIVNLLKIKFSLSDILVGGSNLLGNKFGFNDFDIIINGKGAGIKASRLLNEITKNEQNKLLIEQKRYHRRRFRVGKMIICPFSIHKKDNFFEIAKRKKLEKSKKIIAKVIDCSESLFSPSIYKIKIKNGKNYLLISYFVGHNHLFRKGEIIEFKAPLFEFCKNSIKKQAFVIPIQGSWIDIKIKKKYL